MSISRFCKKNNGREEGNACAGTRKNNIARFRTTLIFAVQVSQGHTYILQIRIGMYLSLFIRVSFMHLDMGKPFTAL